VLDQLIPPEIKNDELYFLLHRIAAQPALRTFLEIGSSSGEGSTEALVSGLRARPDRGDVRLFCMELSRERFARLRNTYVAEPFVRPYNLSSVGTRRFPSPEAVTRYYTPVRTGLNN
jgi:hypothetical protein